MPIETVEVQKKRFTFKLRSGMHDVIDPVTKVVRHMVPGDMIETDEDLKRIWDRKRWEKVVDAGQETLEDLKARIRQLERLVPKDVPVVEESAEPIFPSDDLNNKSVKELRALAAEMDPPVDLTTCTGKNEIVKVIRSAMDAA